MEVLNERLYENLIDLDLYYEILSVQYSEDYCEWNVLILNNNESSFIQIFEDIRSIIRRFKDSNDFQFKSGYFDLIGDGLIPQEFVSDIFEDFNTFSFNIDNSEKLSPSEFDLKFKVRSFNLSFTSSSS